MAISAIVWALLPRLVLELAQLAAQLSCLPLAVSAKEIPAVTAVAALLTTLPLPVKPLIKPCIRFLPHFTACAGRLLIQLSALEKPPLKAVSILEPMLFTPFATLVRMFLPMFSQLMAEITDSTACRIFFQLASREGTACMMPVISCTMMETPCARILGILSLMMPAILMMISGT